MTTTINASTSSGLVQTADTSGILQLQTANTAAMTIDASQNVSVGGTYSANGAAGRANINLSGTSSSILNFNVNGANYGYLYHDSGAMQIVQSANNVMLFSTNSAERMRISATGAVGIGTTAPVGTLNVKTTTSGEFPTNYTTGSNVLISTGDGGANNAYLRVLAGVYTQVNSANLDLLAAGNDYGNNIGWRLTSIADGAGAAGSRSLRFNQMSTDGSGNLVATEALRLNSVGNLALKGGTPSSSVGIAFPATQVASSDANTLDDYEEGTWTISDASGAGLSITNNSTPSYTKVGRLVVAKFDVTYPGTASGSNAAFNAPFASDGAAYSGGYNVASNYGSGFSAQVSPSSTTTQLIALSGLNLTNANLSGKRLIMTLVYFTT